MVAKPTLNAPRLDGCPSCMTRDNKPTRTEHLGPERGILCAYVCRACGRDWTCQWWDPEVTD